MGTPEMISNQWLPQLRPATALPSHPLRGGPHGDEHDCENDKDLAPEYLGRGHGDRSIQVPTARNRQARTASMPV